MLDPDLIDYMDNKLPRFNEKLTQGLAYSEQDKMIQYVEGVLKMFSKSISEQTGIQFTGLSHVTPMERLRFETRPVKSRRSFEITRSDYFMVKATFKHDGNPMLTRPIYLPYFKPGARFRIRDVYHMALPTLADEFFSIEDGSIFVPVTRARFTINRQAYSFVADGSYVNVDYYWAKLHRNKKNEAPKTRHPQINNYLFAEAGLTQAFKKYYDADIVVGTAEITEDERYSEEEWVVCQSSGIRPQGRISTTNDTSVQPYLLVRREAFERQEVRSAIASFFYIADMCRGLEFFCIEDLDDSYLWERLLSHFIWKDIDERVAIDHVREHIASIDDYIDDFVLAKMHRMDIPAKNINEFFAYVVTMFPALVTSNNVAATLGKRLSVVEELLFPVQTMLFNLMFVLQRTSKDQLRLTSNVENIFNREWKWQTLFYLGTSCDAVRVLESATDQNIFRAGSQMHIPSKTSAKSKSSEMGDPAFTLHPDMLITNSWFAITKASPTARDRFNIFMQIDPHNQPILQEKHKEQHASLSKLL